MFISYKKIVKIKICYVHYEFLWIIDYMNFLTGNLITKQRFMQHARDL